jgi:hypothetical protein
MLLSRSYPVGEPPQLYLYELAAKNLRRKYSVKKYVIAGMVLAVAGSASASVIIDPFGPTSQTLGAPAAAGTNGAGVAATGAIGGNRYSQITKVSGSGVAPTGDTLDINNATPGLLEFNTASGDDSNILVRWDGDTDNILNFGLTGADLTQVGLNNLIRLSLQSDLIAGGSVVVYKDAFNFSTATFNTPGLGFAAFTNVDLLFTSFVDTGAGANFADAKAIEFRITGVPSGGLDVGADFISAETSEAPEPASMALIGGGLTALAYMLRRRTAA